MPVPNRRNPVRKNKYRKSKKGSSSEAIGLQRKVARTIDYYISTYGIDPSILKNKKFLNRLAFLLGFIQPGNKIAMVIIILISEFLTNEELRETFLKDASAGLSNSDFVYAQRYLNADRVIKMVVSHESDNSVPMDAILTYRPTETFILGKTRSMNLKMDNVVLVCTSQDIGSAEAVYNQLFGLVRANKTAHESDSNREIINEDTYVSYIPLTWNC